MDKLILRETERIFSKEQILQQYTDSMKNGLYTFEKNIIFKYFTSIRHKKILNLGCGTGREGINLCKLGAKVDFVDISVKMLEKVTENLKRENMEGNVFLSDCLDFKFVNDKKYDLIFATNNFLEHIPNSKNREKVIENCYEALKTNGYLITCVHDRNYNPKWSDYWEKQKTLIEKGVYYKGYKLEYGDKLIENIVNDSEEEGLFMHIYSVEEISEQFSKSNFIIKETSYIYNLMEKESEKDAFSRDVFFIVGGKE